MLIGSVSDEQYSALCDAVLEFINLRGESWEARSRASGAVPVALPPGPYCVLDGNHWAFLGTDLKPGDRFGEKSLHRRSPGGASGHETDKVSPSTPTTVKFLAKGLNPNDGGAEMILFDTASGGKVFSVGSINSVASLPVDEPVSQVTKNVLSRFLE